MCSMGIAHIKNCILLKNLALIFCQDNGLMQFLVWGMRGSRLSGYSHVGAAWEPDACAAPTARGRCSPARPRRAALPTRHPPTWVRMVRSAGQVARFRGFPPPPPFPHW